MIDNSITMKEVYRDGKYVGYNMLFNETRCVIDIPNLVIEKGESIFFRIFKHKSVWSTGKPRKTLMLEYTGSG